MTRTPIGRILNSHVVHHFQRSPVAVASSLMIALIGFGAALAPLVSPYDLSSPGAVDLMNANDPPLTIADAGMRFLLGTDNQGRDLLTLLLFGTRISLFIGIGSVLLAMAIGVTFGLLSGFIGGYLDAFLMRLADIQLSFPAILMAILIDGLARAFLPVELYQKAGRLVLIIAIGLSNWVLFARTTRGAVLVEKNRDYVKAARIIGRSPMGIAVQHVLPNILGPILVIATINLAMAILTEATLSYLGVGLSPTEPSLGTLIQIGQEFLFSGVWWIAFFPGVMLLLLVLSVNLLGDWLRDVTDPKLR